MNNTFDIKRFGLLLQKDLGEYFLRLKSKMGAIFIVYAGILLYVWVSGLIFGTPHMDMDSRLAIMTTLTLVAVIMAPTVLYGHANHKLMGIGYAMLPASSLEKFLTMFIMAAILTPILCLFSLVAIDTLLSFLPLNSAAVANIFTFDMSTFKIKGIVPSMSTWIFAKGIITTAIVFLFGNMIFQGSKISRTILSVILIWVVLATISMLLYTGLWKAGYILHGEDLLDWFEDIPLIIQILTRVVGYSIAALILFFTYRKIKTQQY